MNDDKMRSKKENIAGLLHHAILRTKANSSSVFEQWFQSLNSALSSPTPELKKPIKTEYQLLYILNKTSYRPTGCNVTLLVTRQLKGGNFGNTYRHLSSHSETHMRALQPIDHDILHRLEVSERLHNPYAMSIYQDSYELQETMDASLLIDMINTGRCYWGSHQGKSCLTLGNIATGQFSWQLTQDGHQQLCCLVDNKRVEILPLTPPWYLDPEQNQSGPLTFNMAPHLASTLLAAPPIAPQNVSKIKTLLKDKVNQTPDFPLPHSFTILNPQNAQPKPKLVLFGLTTDHHLFYKLFRKSCVLPLGRISFNYDGVEVSTAGSMNFNVVNSATKTLNVIARNLSAETVWVEDLLKQGLGLFSRRYPEVQLNLEPLDFLVAPIEDKIAQENFLSRTLPILQQAGWEIKVEQSFPVEYVISVDDWYTEIYENNKTDWFSMELGFLLDGQKINILPLLVNFIEKQPEVFNEKHLNALKNENFVMQLPNGHSIGIPAKRIKGILATLTELYDAKSLNKSGLLPVSRIRAAQLLDLEKAMKATRMRWLGETQLKQLSDKLAHFTSMQSVQIPKQFKGVLRDYQKIGVDWLNFLREYQLPGILADDMGLGKTIQTLAHLLIEKQEGRMKHPCLIVAPTSLMENWRNEASQFTPSLKVLVLQGQERKASFYDIEKSDLVLTTYPLIVRDKDILLGHQYHTVILDEAQFIKNANTKAYLILQQIKTSHRLCLTGTPMENHLGELWSLYNFLSPGLLGDSKQFTQIFRNPIEKQGDQFRRLSLNQRIKPYLLRRTKEEVVLELPPKTEITHKLILDEKQRDLYESIRLAMETKIKKAIESKGVAGSQIIILDALLKLRQTCCDPRLLKLEQAKKVKSSAKLDFLMEMLTSLMEENKKVLLFSSFTSMLSLIEEALKERNMNFVKLTGSTLDRKTPIKSFQKGEVPIFLISLKAGGTGLNLTAADTVIHYDPWWNPAAEAQATDRAHRIGQTKPVFVYKLVTAGTVEEKILKMQEKKRALLMGLFDENQGSKAGVVTAEDLKFLFQPINDVT